MMKGNFSLILKYIFIVIKIVLHVPRNLMSAEKLFWEKIYKYKHNNNNNNNMQT